METPGTYFVGRAELLAWINSTLGLSYIKIEQVREVECMSQASTPAPTLRRACSFCLQTHNGSVACQIIDALHPGNIAFSRVRSDRMVALPCGSLPTASKR